MCHRISSTNSTSHGLALVEMVVATAITVLLLGVAFHFFDDLESMTESVSVMSEVNENLRSSTDLITRDLYAAGTSIPTGGIPIPSGTGSEQVTRPGPGSTYFPATNGVLSVITPGYQLSGTIDGKTSDEITVTMVDQNWVEQPALEITSISSSSSTGYTVNVAVPASCTQNCTIAAGGAYTVNDGDLLMFSTPNGPPALG
ncbi:MAG: PilW family protein, partial [Terriglobia bacterium]